MHERWGLLSFIGLSQYEVEAPKSPPTPPARGTVVCLTHFVYCLYTRLPVLFCVLLTVTSCQAAQSARPKSSGTRPADPDRRRKKAGSVFFSSRLLVLLGKLTVFQSEADSRDTDTVRL